MRTQEARIARLAREARAAVDRADWQAAADLLRAAAATRPLTSEELDLLAQASYGSGELEAAISAWEELHRRNVAAGDLPAAATAAVTIAMYLMMDTGLMAPVRGWAARAERLLDGADESATHAWLAMIRTYERLLSGDLGGTRAWAEAAIDLGVRHGAPAPAAIGRVALARTMICDGEVEAGLALLDEAAVATVSGELDPLSVGMVYCELVCAMQGLAQYDRAEQWTDAMLAWRDGNAFGGIGGRCRVHRAEILRLRGSCDAAEAEALQACDELRPWMRREFGWPLTELGTIRLRRGDLAGAEAAFREADEHGWEPQPGLALLRYARGDAAGAAASIRDALERPLPVPSKERPPYGALPRAPLLAAEAEIAVATGDVDRASEAADELAAIARTFRSRALEAAACLARARVDLARDEAEAALRAGQEALAGWTDVGAPYEVAVVRQVLAAAARSCGSEVRSDEEARAAMRGFARIGAVPWVAPTVAVRPPERLAETEASPREVVGEFRRDGDLRRIRFGDHAVTVRDLKGMRYLDRLLAEPGREFHVLDLVGPFGDPTPSQRPAAGELPTARGEGALPVLDDAARDALRRRLAEIEEDLEDAERQGDPERRARAEADRDYLVRELARAFGLGGRPRETGSTSERARASVTRTLRYTLARIAEHHPPLAEHLRHSIRTGTYCSYQPDPTLPVRWSR